ncbi:uncharacterized protein LOC122575574 isoform X1 [Bombus pyrosoma]|uniref:uncharacterized protein LOC122575574 isoform X1 n=1 Tax=Bombus pyrosoma TaxID=396416 RepID=UPI001CB977E0|nr:uncharacterized protein LOC122575574 isoform X1 [Bombus pyrosoma]
MINPMNFHGTLMQLQLVRLLWDRLNGGSKAKNGLLRLFFHSVPSDVWSPGMGGRSDGESSQHPAPQEAAQGNRHQNRQGIPNSVSRVGDRSGRISSVEASGVGAQKEIHSHEIVGPGRGLDRAGGPKRPRNRRGQRVRPVAIPAAQRGRRTSRRGGGPSK